MLLMEKKFRDKTRRFDARVALHGLGGTGKSQLALEYSYRARDAKLYSHIFWISGEPKQFIEGYYKIASLENLKVSRYEDERSMQTVQSWLESNTERHKPWLLVVDGLDDVKAPVFEFLPKYGGQILLTGRTEDVATRFANQNDGINVDKMEYEEAKQLFERLASLPVEQDYNDLDGLLEDLERLPLAILQAATFIRQISRTQKQPILWYLDRFRQSLAGQQDLLSRSRKTTHIDSDASSSLMTTWKITFDHLASEHPNSMELFKILVYLSPVQVPARIFDINVPEQSKLDGTIIMKKPVPAFLCNEVNVEEALGTLTAFAFLSYSSDKSDFQIHRLVRLAMMMELRHRGETQPFIHTLMILATVFPEPEIGNLMECSMLYPHLEEALSHTNTEIVSTSESRLLILNLLLRSMMFLRLYGRKDEVLELIGRIDKEKRNVPESERCGDTMSEFNLRLFLTTSMVYIENKLYGSGKKLSQLRYDILLERYGKSHPRTLESLNNLAWVESLPEGDHHRAEANFEEVIRRTKTPELRRLNIEAKRGLTMLLKDTDKCEQAYQLFSETIDATREIYGESSVEFAMGLTDLADLQCSEAADKRVAAATNRVKALPTLLKNLGPEHPKYLHTAWKLGVFIVDLGHLLLLEFAEHLFRELVATPKTLIVDAGMEPFEMLSSLASALELKGGAEALEEAVCLTRAVVVHCQHLKGSDHARTIEAQSSLACIENSWREAIKGQEREPVESRWMQEIQGVRSYDPRRVCRAL